MTVNDVINFANKNNISISSSESIIIYNYIKRYYKFILNNDDSSLSELKNSLRKDLYDKIIELYMYYKNKLF